MLRDSITGSGFGGFAYSVPKLVLYLTSNRWKMLSLLKARTLTPTRLVARLAVVCVECMSPPILQPPARLDSACGAHVRRWRKNRVIMNSNGNGNGDVLEPQLLGRFPAMSELI